MRTAPNGRRFVGLLPLFAFAFVYVGCIALVTSCAPCGSGGGTAAAAEKKERTVFWDKLESSTRGPGPYMYVATELITLADGTQVSCMTARNKPLWCKEVVSRKPTTTQTSNRFEPAPLRSSAPADLGGLDFGGSP